MSEVDASERVAELVAELGPWFQNMLLDGVWTAPEHPLHDYPAAKWRLTEPILPNLAGKSVLDIGCNAAFHAMALKALGAREVLGLEPDPRYRTQARLAAQIRGMDIGLADLSVYELPRLGRRFDLVVCMGVLYHLRHPLLALDLIWEHACGEWLLFQSLLRGDDRIAEPAADYAFCDDALFQQAGMPAMRFVEHRFAGDPTNWWVPNRACAEAMLRSAGFRIERQAGEDVYLCRRVERAWGAQDWSATPWAAAP